MHPQTSKHWDRNLPNIKHNLLSSPKGKELREQLKNTSSLYIFTSSDRTNYQCMCVQTEGFFLILDEKFILTPTAPADASYLEIKREKTWKFMTSWGSDSLVETCPVTFLLSSTEWQVLFCTSHRGAVMSNLKKSLTVRTVNSSSTYTLSVSISSFMTWLQERKKEEKKIYYVCIKKKHRQFVQAQNTVWPH